MASRALYSCQSFRFSRSQHNNLQLLALQVRLYSDDIPGKPQDADVRNLGRAIVDDFATIRSKYRKALQVSSSVDSMRSLNRTETPKNPVVLAHGLLGFDELHLAGHNLPGIHYWRGIAEAMSKNGIEVITTHVPASSSIEERAAKLSSDIETKAKGKSVNIIA